MGARKYFRERLKGYFRADVYCRLWPFMWPYKWLMAAVVTLSFVSTGLDLLGPWPMAYLVDSGLLGRPVPEWLTRAFPPLAGASPRVLIVLAVLSGVVLYVVGSLGGVLSGHLKSRVNSGITLAFRAGMFNHLQRLSLSYHDQTSVGDSVYRLNVDTDFVPVLLWSNFRHLLTASLTLVGILWIVAWMDWQLTLLALAIAPFLYGWVWFYGKHFKPRNKDVRNLEARPMTIVQEVLSCLRVVKAFGTEDREQCRFERCGGAVRPPDGRVRRGGGGTGPAAPGPDSRGLLHREPDGPARPARPGHRLGVRGRRPAGLGPGAPPGRLGGATQREGPCGVPGRVRAPFAGAAEPGGARPLAGVVRAAHPAAPPRLGGGGVRQPGVRRGGVAEIEAFWQRRREAPHD